MRSTHFVAITVAALAIVCAPAKAATVTQYINGVVEGDATIDTLGYFAAPGTNLKGKPIQIYMQYTTQGYQPAYCPSDPQTNCTVNVSSTNATNGLQDGQLVRSVLISVQINNTHRSFSPVHNGEVYTASTPSISGSPSQFTLFADPGATSYALVNLYFALPTAFGAELSPANTPVNIENTGGGLQNQITLSLPVPGATNSEQQSETLTITIKGAGR